MVHDRISNTSFLFVLLVQHLPDSFTSVYRLSHYPSGGMWRWYPASMVVLDVATAEIARPINGAHWQLSVDLLS